MNTDDETFGGFRVVESDALAPDEVLLYSPPDPDDPRPPPLERRAVLLRLDQR